MKKKNYLNILPISNKYKVNFKINLQSSREKLLFTLLTIKKKMFSTICLDLYAIFNKAQPFLFFYRFFSSWYDKLIAYRTHENSKKARNSQNIVRSKQLSVRNSSKEFPPDPWNHITNGFHGKHVSTADTKNRDKRDDFDWTHFCTETNSFVLNI